jgi:hypothetical protein
VVKVSTAKTYRFYWPDSHCGWANFTVCDETGEFNIQSDWGNFSHGWSTKHLGNNGKTTLTEFLACRTDHWYLVNKLSYENAALKDVCDQEATFKRFAEEIIQKRREHRFTKEEARILWGQCEEFCEALDHHHGLTDGMWHDDDWQPVFDEFEDISYYIMQKKPTVWTILEEELLPRFAAYLREHVLPHRKNEPSQAQPTVD